MNRLPWWLVGTLVIGPVVGLAIFYAWPFASLVIEADKDSEFDATEVAVAVALGAYLRNYKFDKYKTKKDKDKDNGEAESDGLKKLVVHCAEPKKAEKAFARQSGVADGVLLARDLVNEPANELGPIEFAQRAQALDKLGEVSEIVDKCSFSYMKENQNTFEMHPPHLLAFDAELFRRGTGDRFNDLPADVNERMLLWCAKEIEGSGFPMTAWYPSQG